MYKRQDKYCYITARHLPPFFEHRFCLVYSKIEYCQTIEEIAHPAVREVLRFLDIGRGVEIHHDGDIPARSGMGSSSAFTVGLLHALYALKGQMVSKHQLAMESVHLEQEVLKETVGSQDQVLAAYGGFNHITFAPNGEISVRPVTLSRERMLELNAHVMLFYTGIKRTASTIAETYVNDIDDKRRQLRLMRELVDEGVSILGSGQDLAGFGELLHEAWQAKRSLSAKVSNSHVDELGHPGAAGQAHPRAGQVRVRRQPDHLFRPRGGLRVRGAGAHCADHRRVSRAGSLSGRARGQGGARCGSW